MIALIACYSQTGNTLNIAKDLQKSLNADLTRIEAVKDKWYLFNVWDSLRGNQIPIKPCKTDLRDYGSLVVCFPVCASNTPPPVNEYLTLLKNAKDTKFTVLINSKSNKSQNAARYIREYLTNQEMEFMGQMMITKEDIKKDKYKEMMKLFVRRFKALNEPR